PPDRVSPVFSCAKNATSAVRPPIPPLPARWKAFDETSPVRRLLGGDVVVRCPCRLLEPGRQCSKTRRNTTGYGLRPRRRDRHPQNLHRRHRGRQTTNPPGPARSPPSAERQRRRNKGRRGTRRTPRRR